jgi:hypothetical protein
VNSFSAAVKETDSLSWKKNLTALCCLPLFKLQEGWTFQSSNVGTAGRKPLALVVSCLNASPVPFTTKQRHAGSRTKNSRPILREATTLE